MRLEFNCFLFRQICFWMDADGKGNQMSKGQQYSEIMCRGLGQDRQTRGISDHFSRSL